MKGIKIKIIEIIQSHPNGIDRISIALELRAIRVDVTYQAINELEYNGEIKRIENGPKIRFIAS